MINAARQCTKHIRAIRIYIYIYAYIIRGTVNTYARRYNDRDEIRPAAAAPIFSLVHACDVNIIIFFFFFLN